VSQIYEALTIAHDRAVEQLVDRRLGSPEPVIAIPVQVRLSHRKIRNWLILMFVAVGLMLVATSYTSRPKVTFLETRPISGVTFEGTLRPGNEVRITADAGGTISTISVQVGDTVNKDQQLLQMDPRDAESALRQAGVELQVAEFNLAQFRGQLAEVNARMAVMQREEQQIPTRQWRDSPERATAVYELARNNYNRAKTLYEAGINSQQDLDARATELRIAQDDLENAKKLAGVSAQLEHGQSSQADLQAKVTRAELQELLRQAQVKYRRAKEQLEATVVRATESGVVSEIPIHLGDRIPSGSMLVCLAKLDHMIVEVPVAARMIGELKVGQPAQVALPSSPPRQVEGRVRVINPLPSANMTHVVEVEFDNPNLLLLAGQAAEVRFSKP